MNTFSSLGLAVGFISITSAAAFAQQGGYPMICRGGGAMKLGIFAGTVIVRFEPTEVGAGVAPPGPGQCGWLDRGYRPGEPASLQFSGNPDGVHYLVNGVLRGDNFYVHVHKDGDVMTVDRIGP
jgi:hypothetical protein